VGTGRPVRGLSYARTTSAACWALSGSWWRRRWARRGCGCAGSHLGQRTDGVVDPHHGVSCGGPSCGVMRMERNLDVVHLSIDLSESEENKSVHYLFYTAQRTSTMVHTQAGYTQAPDAHRGIHTRWCSSMIHQRITPPPPPPLPPPPSPPPPCPANSHRCGVSCGVIPGRA